jgi:hypothetical protein
MTFPISPTNGQQTTENGIVYTYNSTLGVWAVGSTSGTALSADTLAVSNSATIGTTLAVTGAANLSSTLSVAGNITGGNLTTGGLISATGNVSGGNLNVTGNIVDSGALSIITGSNGNIALAPNGTGLVTSSANVVVTGFVNPAAGNTYDLGTTTLRWRNIYTNDLQLSNGIGDYTIVEGEQDLFLYNNKTNKTFKFALIEVDPNTVPPKANTE